MSPGLKGRILHGNYYWDSASRPNPGQQEAMQVASQGPHIVQTLEVSGSPKGASGMIVETLMNFEPL